jgi:hypothetical protein
MIRSASLTGDVAWRHDAAMDDPTRTRRARAQRLEVALCALLVLGVGLLAPSWELPLGRLVAYSAVVLLGQGLVRDLARLVARRRTAPTERLLCLCAESSIGVLLVLVGIGLTLAGSDRPVPLSRGALTAGVAGLLLVGFVAKDWAIVLRRVEDHGTIALGPPR